MLSLSLFSFNSGYLYQVVALPSLAALAREVVDSLRSPTYAVLRRSAPAPRGNGAGPSHARLTIGIDVWCNGLKKRERMIASAGDAYFQSSERIEIVREPSRNGLFR